MTYTLSTTIIAQRTPDLLAKTGDPLGADPYNRAAPGLYPGETLYQIDGVGLAAVSVETMRLANNGGLAITARARAIEDDGATRRDAHGTHLETEFVATFDWGAVDALGQAVIEREMLRAVMGEPGGVLPADAALDLPERPILHCERPAVSIVRAVAASATAGIADAAALLT